ncbi:MAG: peptidoglycan-binding protein, partial [Clostridia bacterium]|nr:peptidoglycan-binding protein [Clostridia bacterium]
SIPALTNKKTVVYAYATTASSTLATLNQDTLLTLLGHNSQWGLIDYNGHRGYVDIGSLLRYSNVTLTEDEHYPATVTVAGSVKKYAYETSTGAGSVSVGMKVNVLAHTTYWALIERNGHKGYYPVTGLKIQLDEFVSPVVRTFEATVICAAPAYVSALESSNRLGTIPIATDVTVTAYTDKWARISYSGVTAYLLKNCLSVTEYTELKNGVSAANQILALQRALEELGYFDGLPAGNYGSLTTNAVSRFQTQIGLSASGVADKTTQRVLYGGHAPQSPIKSANLAKGSVGNNVTRLQTRLTYKGYLSAGIDGDFGNITQSAVKLYQKVAGLEETGVADSATLSSLFSSSAPKNTGAAVSGSGSSSSGGSASTGNYSTNPNDDPASGTASANIETVITHALQQLGKPYIYATSGPNSYDCSGFTSYCYRKIGISLGRSAYAQGYGRGTKIESVSELRRGDIVCMNTITDSDLSDHVGIYLGGGKFIHASSAAGKVIISSITSGYYNRVFSWGRRIV